MSDNKNMEVRVAVRVSEQYGSYRYRGESEMVITVPIETFESIMSEISKSISMTASSLVLPAYQEYLKNVAEETDEDNN